MSDDDYDVDEWKAAWDKKWSHGGSMARGGHAVAVTGWRNDGKLLARDSWADPVRPPETDEEPTPLEPVQDVTYEVDWARALGCLAACAVSLGVWLLILWTAWRAARGG